MYSCDIIMIYVRVLRLKRRFAPPRSQTLSPLAASKLFVISQH